MKKILAREIDIKGHTLRWNIDGEWVSKVNAFKMAKNNEINAIACNFNGRQYIRANKGEDSLNCLPRFFSNNNKLNITKRGVDIKRHTVKWLVGSKWRSVERTVELAKNGRINNIHVCNDQYVRSMPGTKSLTELPEVLV